MKGNKLSILTGVMALMAIAAPGLALASSPSVTQPSAPVAASEDSYKGFQAGDFLVRGRMLAVLPTVTSSVSVIGGQVDASKSFEPEADLTYFMTPNIAVEAIAAITRHHITDKGSILGNQDLGHTTLLPPTITAQYHFLAANAFSPYVGAGVNYTIFFDSTLPSNPTVKKIEYENGFGEAIQLGADYHVSGNWYANVDVKHIFLNTRAKINGGAIDGYVALDPTIVGLGVGYKF